ncbi:MAG: SIMPL domain-containing protein [Cyclobacteriaceae bacterium]
MKYLILLFLILPSTLFAQIDSNKITVIGTAHQEIEPDWINLGMSARETENTRKESDVVVMENAILEFLRSLGLDQNAFSIDRYSANTKYSYSTSSKFKLSKSYTLKIERVDLLDTIIAKCFESGIDNIYVNQIGHSKIDSIQNLVLREALISARSKAELISETTGVELGRVASVNESYHLINNQPGSYIYDDFRLDEVVVVGYGSGRSRTGSSVSFQKITVNKTVVLKYNIL